MANVKTSFSPKEFELAIAHEETIGTATSTLTNFKLLNIDSIEMPALNPQQVLDVRHGAGRTLKTVDMFLSNNLTVKEISFTGVADATVLPLLLKNITQTSNVASLHIPASYDPSELKVGDAGGDSGTSTFSVLLNVPESSNSMMFTGCVLTSLTLNGDIGEESGRIKMSGTFKTGKKPSFTDNNNPSDTSHFNTNYFVTDYEGTNAAQVIAGVTSPIMKSFSCTLENDAQFMGFDSSGNYQIIARALPEAIVNFESVVKYDSDTDGLVATFEQQSTSTVANTLTAKDGATRNIDFSIPKAIITDVSFSEEEAMFLSVSTRAVAGTSGNLVAFTIQ
tara:strand:+ start:203 stop:1210 length:1008 start_codon:yes stop_codon:yes gene_type:complete